MASDSPGSYKSMSDSQDCQEFGNLITDTNLARGHFQMGVVSGFHRDASYVMKDSGYYVNTSDGASTCSSSTTEPGENEGGTLLVLEPKSLRSFTTNDEYLYAMKEDLADWFACLYQRDDLTAENFFQILETGVLLCKHANKVQDFASQRREMGESLEMRSYFIRSVPAGNVSFREGVKPETFQARDNVSNFISWGRQLGIPEVLSFETDDLVLRKNEKSVILCLLEIARVGAKLGMLAPTLIQMEQEIDAELAGEEPKPHIQIITCDMRSLDERVRDLIGRCTCPVQFPMIKVGEGKYKIGDSRSLIFVRILRNHVMVRVGGGWDTLENYLNKHDPCQCNYRGHRPTTGAAHKVVVSQQRQAQPATQSTPAPRPAAQPATQTTPAPRPIPSTPTSPRRGSTAAAAAAARHRSSSPHSSSAKAPTLVISRHIPAPPKRGASPESHTKTGAPHPHNNQHVGTHEATSHTPVSPSHHAGAHTSPTPIRRRSPSPRTKIPGPPQAQARDKDQGHSKVLTARRCLAESLDRSTSLDEEVHLNSLEQHHESDTTSGHDGAGRASVSMDKISTMTLAEFKSLISSTLSVPEEPKQGSSEAYSGQTGNSDSGSSGSSNTKMTGAYNNGDICRSKMSKIISNTKTPKGSADPDKIAPKDEYQMARPKPPSQIKRDAVAKVAGAISNWVESKTGADTVDAVSGRSKTPARPKTLLGPNNGTSQNVLHECTDEDNLEISGAVVNSLMHPLLCTSQERPVTPSRIPKPSFLPRPKTPVSFLTESPNDVTNHHGFPTHHGTSFNIAKSSINSRPVALSRSNSNSSSVKSIDEAPVSPASSLSDDRVFKLHSKTRRLSNASDSFSTNANTNTTNMGRSYKDIYTAKRAASSGSEGRIPSTRAVTPGPREKWTLCGSGCSSSFSENAVSTPSIPRRRSINISCQADKQKSFCSTSPANHTSSSTEKDQEMTITNEITFSDDEEINELVKNAAMKAKTQNFRSSSVNTRKLVHQTMKGNDELLMIHRDLSMKGNSDVNYSVVRRPASRGSSVDRASPATVASKLSHISNFAVHAHKPVSDGKGSGPDESSIQANKGHNRTDAWVDSTLSDNKKKPSPRPKQTKSFGRDISASELASRPLEEIQAILTEPRNGFVHVDIRTLEPPPEDPEMFRKMEKLFEKYREMELKALAKELSQGGRPAPVKRHSDSQSAKSDRHGSSRRPSKPSTSVKTSSVSFEPSPDHISGHATPATGKVSLHGGDKCARSSSTPKPFHSQQYRSSNNSPAFTSSSYETEHCLGSDISNHNESLSKILKTSGSENDHKGLGVLQDIDPELAKNPAALISKIKEILKVRPRKDENTKGPTRIPAPSALNKQNRSKSVTNLFSDDVSTGSSHDNNISQPDGQVINTNSDKFHDVHSFQSRQHNTFDKFASNEPDGADDVADEVPALTHTWSVQSDSSDSQSKTETPVPKLAMPLTTGRSTLISRKGDRLGRSMSQDKENLANTESMITSQPVLSQTEDEAEFV